MAYHPLASVALQAPDIVPVQGQASLTADSLVSVGLLIAIIGAVAWLSRALTRTEEQLRSINEKLGSLATLPERMALVEASVSNLESDVNNLWAAVRRSNGGLEGIRRDRSALSQEHGHRPGDRESRS